MSGAGSRKLSAVPDQCKAIQERFRDYSAAMIQERQEKKSVQFRQIAYRLHEQGIELFVKRVLKRMAVPNNLDHRIACELLAGIKP